jgi:opacity protein-like surface antigen
VPAKISVGVGAGLLTYSGDIGVPSGSELTNSKITIRPGYTISVEQRFGNKTRYLDLFGFQFNFLAGQLAEEDLSSTRQRIPLNFQSPIYQADFNVLIHLERILNFNRKSRFSPYLLIGVGGLHFHPYTDWYDANGKPHWEMVGGKAVNLSQLDHNYETDLYANQSIFPHNSNNKYSLYTFSIPMGAGLEYNISYYFKVKFEYIMYPTGSDWLDGYDPTNVANKHNDWFKIRKISIFYTFGKPTLKWGHKRIKSRF